MKRTLFLATAVVAISALAIVLYRGEIRRPPAASVPPAVEAARPAVLGVASSRQPDINFETLVRLWIGATV
jgi:hypothetical protein